MVMVGYLELIRLIPMSLSDLLDAEAYSQYMEEDED